MKVMREITLVDMLCGECDVTFAMPDYLQADCRKTGRTWYCPNGHPRVYRKSDNAELKEKLASLESTNTHLRDQLDQAEKSKAAVKGQLTKERKRTANGVCPCCKRSFANLHRHMSNQHPSFPSVDS